MALEYVPIGRFDVTYLDGRTEKVQSNFGAVMELEAHYAKTKVDDILGGTVLARAMWLYLGRPKESLEVWAADVHMIVPASKNGDEADPTPPAAGDG